MKRDCNNPDQRWRKDNCVETRRINMCCMCICMHEWWGDSLYPSLIPFWHMSHDYIGVTSAMTLSSHTNSCSRMTHCSPECKIHFRYFLITLTTPYRNSLFICLCPPTDLFFSVRDHLLISNSGRDVFNFWLKDSFIELIRAKDVSVCEWSVTDLAKCG